jgi:hypothetical protein
MNRKQIVRPQSILATLRRWAFFCNPDVAKGTRSRALRARTSNEHRKGFIMRRLAEIPERLYRSPDIERAHAGDSRLPPGATQAICCYRNIGF